jgi:hypothetical protein
MMWSLEMMLKDRDIAFDAVECQVMCFAHIIDLSSGQVTCSAGNMVDSDGDNSSSSDNESAASDPIARGCSIVRVIRGSGMRQDTFDEVVKNGNERGWFKSGRPPVAVKIKSLQLLRDVRTRWDSIYLMLNRLREMCPVLLYFR